MTMTTFSFATSSIGSPSTARLAVEWATEHGFGGVEFNGPIRLADVSSDDRAFLSAMANEHGMRYTHHFPPAALPGSHDRATRERDLAELKGHRSVGGIRASIYNAMPRDGVVALRDFMLEFRDEHAG